MLSANCGNSAKERVQHNRPTKHTFVKIVTVTPFFGWGTMAPILSRGFFLTMDSVRPVKRKCQRKERVLSREPKICLLKGREAGPPHGVKERLKNMLWGEL